VPRFYVVGREQAVAAETCKRWWILAASSATSTARPPLNPREATALEYSLREYAELDETIAKAMTDGSLGGLPKLFELRRGCFERIAVEAAADRSRKLSPEEITERMVAAVRTMPVGMAQHILEVLRERGIAA
jgi:hypothetical protein